MTQRFSLYEDLSIRENLDFVARLYAMDRRRERVAEALERLGLANRRDQLAGALSGGWKQRLALAAAVLHEPRLLLLDEPTAGVDPKARREFWDEIHRFAADGMTVLVSTHYMDEAERCHRIAYISYGRLLTEGTIQEVVGAVGAGHLAGRGSRRRRPGAGAARAAGRRDGRALRLDAACQRHRSRRAGGRHRALACRSRPRLAARSRPRSRTCSST